MEENFEIKKVHFQEDIRGPAVEAVCGGASSSVMIVINRQTMLSLNFLRHKTVNSCS